MKQICGARARCPTAFFIAVFALMAGLELAACATSPATGRQVFVGLMSPAEEARIGREQYPEVLKAFGGAYQDPALQSYVNRVGQKLVRSTERKDFAYTFTILDSPIVNALATPGGYVYVTRGVLALANNEAELASVMGHEIGHVAALHHAQAYSREVLARLGLTVIGVVTGAAAIVQGTQLAALVFLRTFSRQEEYEADMLSARYMARASYDPGAPVTLLQRLQAYTELEAKIQGRPIGSLSPFDYLATHPSTADRIQQMLAQAKLQAVRKPTLGRDTYLDEINGMLYGESSAKGFIRGRVYTHPVLRVQFEVPPDFELFDTDMRVYAAGPAGAVIVFDTAEQTAAGSIADYLRSVWARGLKLSGVRTFRVAGFDAASGSAHVNTNRGLMDLVLVAIRAQERVYRFTFTAPSASGIPLAGNAQRTLETFRTLSGEEAVTFKPLRIRVVTVKRGDTIGTLAQRMAAKDYKIERFLVLNGLSTGQTLAPGTRVKVVTE